ncbi:aspartate-semialdehyde dehydrogenase [Candidatus Saccharibacteria bacterium]|nr:MAG: aspartate-semialdehyde dehydrogenase [Candidatus Saccharibacteria bacterium]
MNTYKAAVLGATGMVGQRFISLLDEHPWFQVVAVAASPRSAGKSYREAVGERWTMAKPIPSRVADLTVLAVEANLEAIAAEVDVVFCALDMEKEAIRRIEKAYAAAGVAVISNNSAHRWTEDVPMIMPEVNPEHAALIHTQRKNRGWTHGFIAVKPNCSIQSYVSVLTALKAYRPIDVDVTSLQAISGAGKTFATWPEMVDNVIPYIGGEEEKSEKEPMKIWGTLADDSVQLAASPTINATCIRVPVSDGHMASVRVQFAQPARQEELVAAMQNFSNPLAELALPSAPKQLIQYIDDESRPQTKLDRDYGNGMGVSVGRLRALSEKQWQFIALAHNTVRGAAGGAVLMAELLAAKGYIHSRAGK